MATENLIRVAATSGLKGGISSNENLRSSGSSTGTDAVAQELGMLLRGHSRLDSNLNWKGGPPNRSGSAPPTVEGSFASLGGLLSSGSRIGSDEIGDVDSEQGLRSDPSYLAYYYAHVNLNPRLPPPIISRENYILAQRLANANLSDKRKLTSFDDSNRRSLFSAQPMLPTHKEENEYTEDEKSSMGSLLRQMSDRYSTNVYDGLSGSELYGAGARPKSLVDLIQQDFPRTPSPVYSQQRPSSRLANDELTDAASVRDSSSSAATLNARIVSSTAELNSLHGTYKSSGGRPVISSPLATTVGNLSCPESSESGSAMAPGNGCTSTNESIDAGDSDLSLSLQDLRLSGRQVVMNTEQHDPVEPKQLSQGAQEQSQLFEHKPIQAPNKKHLGNHSQSSMPQSQPLTYGLQHQQQVSGLHQNYSQRKYGPNSPVQHGPTANAYAAAAAAAMSYVASGSPYYSGANMYMPHYGIGAYGVNPSLVPGVMSNYSSPLSYENTTPGIGARTPPSSSMGIDVQQMYKYTSPAGASLQSRVSDPLYLHYLQQQTVEDARNSANVNDSILRAYLNGSHADPLDVHKNQLSSLMHGYNADSKSQFLRSGIQSGSQSGSISPIYYGSPPNVGFAMPYTNSPISSPILPGSPVIPGSLSSRHSSRSSASAAYAGWQGPRSSELAEDLKCSSLLEELKSSKSRGFELTDIAGHVVEFSADQHGSRFIQQKLETASIEEKNLIFQEILPKALTLMTDVFGNYVIQKFFDHGSVEQRSELANQLIGHVLNLSLQMYGCRVIQKALEVISTEQQIRIVAELNGHVMKCVRDQNGNHVIQKCIECVPSEHIEFIISAFHDHIIMLSTHPYGCRVIQRVLEHCTDEQKQGNIMADILHSACSLAQDQYGNYVVQHVLERGKPHEKSEIMAKLSGQFVQMSQHKFASNVVEKCLEFGGPKERQIMITEMLGDTDENEPLQAMMKDQYANYVVQKILETCNDQQRELLLSRIRVHLHALKKYTYGKHIVARVEKLLTAGERRGTQTPA